MTCKIKDNYKRMLNDLEILYKYATNYGLNGSEEIIRRALIPHCAFYIMAVQMDTILEDIFKKERFKHSNNDIRNASIIISMIRNAFAHNPLYPKWLIPREYINNIFIFYNYFYKLE